MLEVQDGDEVKTAEKCGGAYADLLKDEQWRKILSSEFKKPYWERLEKFLESEDKARRRKYSHPRSTCSGRSIRARWRRSRW